MQQQITPYNNIGQIPGKTYPGRVVDQNGAGLYAGWIFLDSEGKPISPDFYTDKDGYFHFTVPDHNWQNIFAQFYATEEFETKVFTFDELVHQQPVVLKSKAGKDLVKWGLGLAALALLTSSKTIGQAPAKKNKWILPASIAAGGIAIWYIFKYKPRKEQKEYLQAAKNRLVQLALDGIVASLPASQFASMVAQLVKSFDKCGTEEEVVYSVFSKLNNEADLYQLIVDYGIAKYDGCFEGSLPSWNVHYTLSESIVSDMTSSERRRVNDILRAKRINFSF